MPGVDIWACVLPAGKATRYFSWEVIDLCNSNLFFFFKNKVFNSYKNKKNSPESGFKDLSFFIFSFFSELPVFCWSLNTTHQRHLFDGESVFGVVCGIEKYYVTSGNKEMKGPSFFTALLRDEANCFISLRFPAALQLVADLQIPPSLTATFYTPFLEIDGSLICLCGCFLILNLEMIFFSRKNSFQKHCPSLGLWFGEQPCKALGLPNSRACSLPWWTMNIWGKQGSLKVDLLVVIA